nr:hypothetical protein [Tanacetum cinerariifolium]
LIRCVTWVIRVKEARPIGIERCDSWDLDNNTWGGWGKVIGTVQFLYHSSANSWQWDLYSSGSGNTLHWQWECIVHFIPNNSHHMVDHNHDIHVDETKT